MNYYAAILTRDDNAGDTFKVGWTNKGQDVKKVDSGQSPLPKPSKGKKKPITPNSLSLPEVNRGHSIHNTAEHEEPDPTLRDAPDSRINR